MRNADIPGAYQTQDNFCKPDPGLLSNSNPEHNFTKNSFNQENYSNQMKLSEISTEEGLSRRIGALSTQTKRKNCMISRQLSALKEIDER
jgi:hypothetical protein